MQDTFDLKDFIITLMRKWRMLVVFGLIFAALGGAYQIVSGIAVLNDPEILAEQKRDDDISMAIFERKKRSLKYAISNIKLELERAQVYSEESLLMRINPFDKAVAAISFYIKTDPQLTQEAEPLYQQPDKAEQIAAAYMQFADTRELYDSILNDIDTEIQLRYLKETLKVSTVTGSGIITVEISGDNAAYCEQIMRQVKSFFEQKKALIDETVFPHELKILGESMYTVVDPELNELQTENQDRVVALNLALQESVDELRALKEPTFTATSKASVIISGIKFMVLGCVAGVGLGILLVFFLDAMSIRIKSAKELRQRFGIKVLGNLPEGGKLDV